MNREEHLAKAEQLLAQAEELRSTGAYSEMRARRAGCMATEALAHATLAEALPDVEMRVEHHPLNALDSLGESKVEEGPLWVQITDVELANKLRQGARVHEGNVHDVADTLLRRVHNFARDLVFSPPEDLAMRVRLLCEAVREAMPDS